MARPSVSKCLFRVMLQKHIHWSAEMLTVLSGERERLGTSLRVHWLRLAFQCRRCRFKPWSGSQDPTCLTDKIPKGRKRAIL